jgi:ADP-ribosylglycohydrolase
MHGYTTPEDRCRGVLLGLAAGDRIGGPIRMAIILAESLLDNGRFDPLKALDRYVAWWHEGAFDTGPISWRVLELIASGMTNVDAARQVHQEFGGKTAGCNPAHRASPLAMFASITDDEVHGCVMGEAGLTHYDPLAGEIAAIVVKLCRMLIRGVSWENAFDRCVTSIIREGQFNSGGFAPDVLRAALYFVGSSATFAEALEKALVFAGMANYSPVLVGAISGARWGATAIPRDSLAHVDILPEIETVADRLASDWR